MKRALACLMLTAGMVLFSAPFCSAQSDSDTPRHNIPQPLDIVLVLDNSGSMKNNDPEFLTRQVVTNFIESVDSGTRLGMVVFDKDARLIETLTNLSDKDAKSRFLKSLDQVDYRGLLTNSPAGIERAIYELKTNSTETSAKVIIFLTDGIVDTGDKDQDIEKTHWLQNDLTLESKMVNIRIFGIAFTDQADYRLIQTVALKTDGAYFRVFSAEDIGHVFNKIIDEIKKPFPEPEKKPAASPEPKVVVIQQPPPAPVPQRATETPPPPPTESSRHPMHLIVMIFLFPILAFLLFVFWRRSRTARGYAGTDVSLPKAELKDVGAVATQDPILLTQTMTKIGRDPNCDVVIPKETISSLHATIRYRDEHFFLEDQRSTNETRLNEQKLHPHKPIRLKSGDRIKFDLYEFKFLLPDQAPAGGTVLAGHRGSGTVLRPPAPAEQPSDEPPDQLPQGPDVADDGSSAGDERPAIIEPVENESHKIDEEIPKTRLKTVMCPQHPRERATEMCEDCKGGFCKDCMVEFDGRYVCPECAEKIKSASGDGE
jgi:pSer/pThr/pTyr-binding forkhead associated (FHA) protein/Mg-chelatase subunit ChlD